MADPGRDCLTGEIQCINHLVFLNLDTTDKLTQAEIILTDYKTKKKNAYCRKVKHLQIQDYK